MIGTSVIIMQFHATFSCVFKVP